MSASLTTAPLARKVRALPVVLGVAWLLLAAVMGSSLSGCEEYQGEVLAACPSAEGFDDVAPLLEKRCGTLDCHGSLARPLRVYGQGGMRLFTLEELQDPDVAAENGTFPGSQKPTTAEERDFTRRSICGVEPEKMNLVLSGQIPTTDLMMLRKPLEVERHKGGPLFMESGAGRNCLESWLSGNEVEAAECEAAVREL